MSPANISLFLKSVQGTGQMQDADIMSLCGA